VSSRLGIIKPGDDSGVCGVDSVYSAGCNA
jgi:hypothetical protein